MRESVFEFTDVVTPPVALVVFALTTAAMEVEAVVRSACKARAPDDKVPAVSVRVPADHISAAIAVPEVSVRVPEAQMSATKVPNDVSVRAEYDHIEPGKVAAKDVDAVRTAELVFGFTTAATAATISAVEDAFEEVAMTNDRSPFTNVSSSTDPQVIAAGYVPCVPEEKL